MIEKCFCERKGVLNTYKKPHSRMEAQIQCPESKESFQNWKFDCRNLDKGLSQRKKFNFHSFWKVKLPFRIGALYLAALGWIYEDVVLSCQSLSRSQQHSPKSCHSTLQSISSQDKQADFFGSTISNEKTDIAIKWSVILSSFKVIFFGNLPYSNKYNTTWFVVRSNLFALELGFE